MNKNSVKKSPPLLLRFVTCELSASSPTSFAQSSVVEKKYNEITYAFFFVAQTFETRGEALACVHAFFKNTFHHINLEDASEPELFFEKILKIINNSWETIVPHHFHTVVRTANIALGMIAQGTLCIADRGSMHAYLIQCASKNTALIPLLQSNESTAIHSATLFESTVCGVMPNFARIIIATPGITMLGKNDVLANLCNKPTTSIRDVAERIKKKLAPLTLEAVATLIGECKSEHAYQTTALQNIHTQNFSLSLANYLHAPPASHMAPFLFILHTMRKILRFVRHRGMRGISFLAPYFIKVRPSWLKTPSFLKSYTNVMAMKISQYKKPIAHNERINKTSNHVRQFGMAITRTLLLFLLFIFMKIITPMRHMLRLLWRRLVHLSLRQKIASGVSLSLIILLLVSIGQYRTRVQKNERVTRIQNIAVHMRALKESLEARIAFNDNGAARLVLGQIEALTKELATLPPEGTVRALDFQKEIAPLVHEIRKETIIESPELVGNIEERLFGATSSTLSHDNWRITFAPQGIMFWHTDLPILNIEKRIMQIGNPSLRITAIYPNEDNVAIDTSEGIFTIEKNKDEARAQEVIAHENQSEIRVRMPYGRALYAIDTNGAVWKHPQSTTGYAKPSLWLKNETPLKDARDLAIDGTLYVLDGNTTLFTLFKGNAEKIGENAVDPPLSAAKKLFTHSNAAFLYVADNERIVVFDKKGILVRQYRTATLSINDFAIDEKNKIGYIVSNGALYRFSLTHIL